MSDASSCRRLEGTAIVRALRTRHAPILQQLEADGVHPRLHVIRVGDHPGGRSQVDALMRQAAGWSIEVEVEKLSASTSSAAIRRGLKRASTDGAIHGIVLAGPLPAPLRAARVVDALAPDKDVEGVHATSQARFLDGRPGLAPAPVVALRAILDAAGESPPRRRALVVARPGMPPVLLLAAFHQDGYEATLVAPADLRQETLDDADALVLVDGEPGGMTARVKRGAVVLDFGVHVGGSGRLVGHADATAVARTAGALTPVPGGVGPVLAGAVLANVTRAARGIGDPAGGQDLPLFGGGSG